MSTQLVPTILELLTSKRIDREVAKALLAAAPAAEGATPPRGGAGDGRIAIVGLAAQLPGARTVEDFWDVLTRGEDRVCDLSPARRALCDGVPASLQGGGGARSGEVLGAWLEDIDRFDADFFGITPAEARAMDPQQRRFLQVAYHCLEDAGHSSRIRGTRTGVYVSAAMTDYMDALPELTPVAVPANVHSFVASRLSHLLDLKGPAFVTSATCASSMLALHAACAGLRAGECETAVAGGVNIFPFPAVSKRQMVSAAGIASDDNRCRPFDDGAGGIGHGEGAVALLLKPLADAQRDGDRIHGVILGSAVNNDGAGAALTAPNPTAHTELLLDAWKQAGTSPEQLSYIEAHGTGTRLGDPIEIKGITDAVRKFTNRRQFLAVGSVKGNIGHLVDGVAGLSGVVKALLVLRHRSVPPSAQLTEPNSHIDFLDSPVFVPSTNWPLAQAPEPLRAGVSCFGFNGTNVHMVLEQAPTPNLPAPVNGRYVFPLSARTETALRTLLALHADSTEPASARDISHTLWAGREHFAVRTAVIATDTEEFRTRCRVLSTLSEEEWGEAVAALGADELAATAREYAGGGMPAWQERYEGEVPLVATLPLYPFDERPYWIEWAPVEEETPEEGTTLERLLVILGRILGEDGLDAGKSFLELGGSSLSGLQLEAALRRSLQATVDQADILSAPSLAELARIIDETGAPENSAAGPAPDARRRTRFPLSTAQRSFWFLSQTENSRGFYHVPMLLRLRGPLDADALRAALTCMNDRHDVLRSRYPLEDSGLPVMEIGDQCPFDLPVEDLRTEPAENREHAARERARELSEEEFDLVNGPVWRGRLLRLGDRDHLLVLILHHLVSDIWSLNVLESELRETYEAYLAGRTPALPPLVTEYGTVAETERDMLAGEEGRRLDAYWRERIASYGPPLELPTDRPRGPQRTLDGATLTFELPQAIAGQLRATCVRTSCTPFMTLLAALAVTLHSRTGRDDLMIGTETAGRSRPGTAELIGAFVNQLALRVGLSGNPDFDDVLRRVRRTVLEAREHEAMPFERLVELVRPRRDGGGLPLFRLKFLFNNLAWGDTSIGDLDVEVEDLDVDVAPFDLTLRVFEEQQPGAQGRFTGSLTYNTSLFDESTMSGLLDEYLSVVRQVVNDPTLHLSEIASESHGMRRQDALKTEQQLKNKGTSLRGFRRRGLSTTTPLVRTRFPSETDSWPLVVEPSVGGVDLAEWIASHRDTVEEHLVNHGAVLFRGFGVSSVDEFHAVSTAVHPELVEYSEPSTPRGEYRDKVYVSSEYPSWYAIPPHGELCYTYKWPMKALFTCQKAATTGGATPLSDARRVLREMDPRVREKFTEKKVLYQRNYGEGMLVPWQKVFDTTDRAEVERHCRENLPMEAEWLSDDRLRTKQVRAAVATHPVTGEDVWFNQAHIFHAYSLGKDMRDQLMEQFGEQGLPVHAFYGDGTPIADWELDEVYRAYEKASWSAPWHEGDVLLADNMLMAHGRQAYTGDREVVVCFVEPCPPAAQRRPSTAAEA